MKHAGTFITGAAFFVIGAAYVIEGFGWWTVDGRVFWPVLVILAGVAILFSGATDRPEEPELLG